MTQILNIQQSIAASNGSVSLAKELFSMLLDDLPHKLQQIENSLREEDMEALTEHIHTIYGATAYCIVPNLRISTAILEEQLRKQDYSQLDDLVKKVQEDIQQLINNGAELIKKDWLKSKPPEIKK